MENIVARRKAFAEQHKLFAEPSNNPEVMQAAMERANLDESVFKEWQALYSTEAIQRVPLS